MVIKIQMGNFQRDKGSKDWEIKRCHVGFN